VPTYDELVLVAQRERLEDDPETIRLFLAALARGTNAVIEDPAAATQAVLGANSGLDPELTEAETAATVPLLARAARRSFRLDGGAWEEFIGWMRDNGLIDSLPAASEVLTNDYLPGTISE
jgi:ABC-type nitrate/sulfonate/bicarbonate transport system substrate-binding protein